MTESCKKHKCLAIKDPCFELWKGSLPLGLERREENVVFVETASNVRAQGFSTFVRICTTEFIVFEVGRSLGEYVAL